MGTGELSVFDQAFWFDWPFRHGDSPRFRFELFPIIARRYLNSVPAVSWRRIDPSGGADSGDSGVIVRMEPELS